LFNRFANAASQYTGETYRILFYQIKNYFDEFEDYIIYFLILSKLTQIEVKLVLLALASDLEIFLCELLFFANSIV